METWQGFIVAGIGLLGTLIGASISWLANWQRLRAERSDRFRDKIVERVGQALTALETMKLHFYVQDDPPEKRGQKQTIQLTQHAILVQVQRELQLLCRNGKLSLSIHSAEQKYAIYSAGSIGADQAQEVFDAYDSVIKAAHNELNIRGRDKYRHYPQMSIPERAFWDSKNPFRRRKSATSTTDPKVEGTEID